MAATPSAFTVFIAEHYAEFKHLAGELGRRKAKLRLLDAFWATTAEEKDRLSLLSDDPESISILSEAVEEINSLGGHEEAQIVEYVDEAHVLGVVVRTDFSDDDAWQTFVDTLLRAEEELVTSADEGGDSSQGTSADSETREDDSSSESEDEEIVSVGRNDANCPTSSFSFLSPPDSSPLRSRLSGASNLSALRLVNDADVMRASANRNTSDDPEHRFSCLHGFVEVYYGPLVWVYDTRSNTDQAARVVSQCAQSAEAATWVFAEVVLCLRNLNGLSKIRADSWRARASFLAELQVNLFSGTMKIDFGGLDRWDALERQKNVADATAS